MQMDVSELREAAKSLAAIVGSFPPYCGAAATATLDKTTDRGIKSALPMSDMDYHDPDLARWLEEAGRRRSVRGAGLEASAPLEAIGEPGRPQGGAVGAVRNRAALITRPRELILLALAAISFQSYFFADVYLQIYSLNSVIVFV